MLFAFIIWSIVAGVFLIIGLSCLKAKEEVGFFTFTKPPKTKDFKAYNRAVAYLWFVFALGLEVIGIPLLFIQQNSPITIVIVLGTVFFVIGMMIVYGMIEKKYKA